MSTAVTLDLLYHSLQLQAYQLYQGYITFCQKQQNQKNKKWGKITFFLSHGIKISCCYYQQRDLMEI